MQAKWFIAIGLLGLLAGCSAPPSPPPLPVPEKPPERVKQLVLQLQRGFPMKLNAIIQGKRLTACEQLAAIEIARVAETFQLALTFVPTAETACTQPLGFEHIVPIPLTGLQAGFYTVSVNGLTAMFELPVDVPLS